MSILDDNHAAVRQKFHAKKTQMAFLRSIPAGRITGNETAEKRSNYVDGAKYARKN